ncbi:hypothetical protein WEI85_43130 [Actinomycetes bacterium KLBMP 9797]
MLAESEDFPHLVEALDGVLRRLGEVSHVWRFDRISTVFNNTSGHVTAAFAAAPSTMGGGGVSAAAGQPQGCGGEANHAVAALVADSGRRGHGRAGEGRR